MSSVKQRLTDRSSLLLSNVFQGHHGAPAGWYSVGLDRPHCCSLQPLLCSPWSPSRMVLSGAGQATLLLPTITALLTLHMTLPVWSLNECQASSSSAPHLCQCTGNKKLCKTQGFTLLSDAPTLLTGCWYLLHNIENKSVSDFSIKLGTHSASRVLSSPTSCTSNQPIS